MRTRCSKCHTDEGARLYKDVSGGYDEFEEQLPDSLPPVADATNKKNRWITTRQLTWMTLNLANIRAKQVVGIKLNTQFYIADSPDPRLLPV